MDPPLAACQHYMPAPEFTLATALRWLGHHCAQHCSSRLSDLPAVIWFVRRRSHARSRGTILVVDPTTSREPVARTHRLIRDINRCTRGEDIQVLGRRTADIGMALSIVTRDAAPLGVVVP